MKKHMIYILLALTCIGLLIAHVAERRKNSILKQKLAELQIDINRMEQSIDDVSSNLITQKKRVATASTSDPTIQTLNNTDPEPTIAQKEKESSGRRMMASMAKMMENPTMNKMMEASQRGAVGALYADLIDYLDLDAEETKYFMDLLMIRQMKQIDLSMKMMGGELSDEEKKNMANELKEASEKVKTEMETFLNNPDDFDEFEFYEKTMGERMMLSQMDAKLASSDASLSDGTYKELLGMMHEEKSNFNFTTDLNDEKNMDLSAERFSKNNLENYGNDMDRLNGTIIERAKSMLTPAQLKAFEESIKTTADMQKAQLEMAGQMFGSKKQSTAP